MNAARELLKIARELMAGPTDPKMVVRDVMKTLQDLDELSDNIEDAVETFNLHFRVAAAVDTDVDSQFALLRKAVDGLEAAKQSQQALQKVEKQFPEDKTVQRALKDADVMIRRFERHEADARKVIKALSQKTMPEGLKKYAQSVARIVKSKFEDPKALLVIPWQTKDYKGGRIYQVVLVVKGVEGNLNGDVKMTLAENTNSREPAGVAEGWGARIAQMSPKEAAAQMLEQLRGWAGLKGAGEAQAKRDVIAQGVLSAIKSAMRRMSAWDFTGPELERGGMHVSGSYRSNYLPKEGAQDVGYEHYRDMVDEEVGKFRKVLDPLLKQYASGIKNVEYYDGEKSWVYVDVELK